MWEADKLCNRVAFMNGGKVAALDTPHSLKQQLRQTMSRCRGRRRSARISQTRKALRSLFNDGKGVTIHSEEATLEDILLVDDGPEKCQ